MAQSYKKPSKLNAVSLIVILGLAALAYCGFKFSPAYYRKWKARGIISETAHKIYPKRAVAEETEFFDEVKKQAVAELRNLGIEDPALRIDFQRSPQEVTATASYTEVVKHPFDKSTTLDFRVEERVEKGNL
jgi:hypothetical protein